MKRWLWIAVLVLVAAAAIAWFSWRAPNTASEGPAPDRPASSGSVGGAADATRGRAQTRTSTGTLPVGEVGRELLRGRVVGPSGPVKGAQIEIWDHARSADGGASACTCENGCAERYFACACDPLSEVAETVVDDREASSVIATAQSGEDGGWEVSVPAEMGELWAVATSSDGFGTAEVNERSEANISVSASPIVGKVVDERGRAIADAWVVAANAPMLAVTTNARGEYALRAAGPAVSNGLMILAPGYVPAETRGGEETTLVRPRAVQVEVFREGRPARGATVTIGGQVAVADPAAACPAVVHADADGRATFARRGPEPVELEARDGDLLGSTRGTAGAVARIELAPGASVVGQITDAAGKPVSWRDETERAHVHLETLGDGPYFSATTPVDATGSYRIGPFPAGLVRLFARGSGAFSRPLERQIAAGEVARADLVLQPMARIAGTARTRRGDPVEGITVLVARAAGADEEVTSTTLTDSGDVVTTGPNGAFELWVDGPGTYELSTRDGRYISTPSIIRAPTADAQLVVEEGGSIRGTVLTHAGAAAGGIEVFAQLAAHTVHGQGEADHAPRIATTSADGTFEIGGLVGGTYHLTATPQEPTLGRSARHTVTIERGGNATVTLRLAGGKPIAGVVLDTQRKPISHAEVSVFPEDGYSNEEPPLPTTATNALGRFEIPHLAEGRPYSVHVSAAGHVGPEGGTTATAGTTDLEIVLRRPGTIRGRAITAEGAPARLFTLNDEVRASADGSFSVLAMDSTGDWISIAADGHAPFVRYVEVEPGKEAFVEARLERARKLSGRLIDAAGAPIPGGFLHVLVADCASSEECAGIADGARGQSDDQGRFVIANAPAAGTLLASHRRYEDRWVDFDAATSSLEIVLGPPRPEERGPPRAPIP